MNLTYQKAQYLAEAPILPLKPEHLASELLMWHYNEAFDTHTAEEWSENSDHSCAN